jgi:hypothetical protein
VFSLLSFDIGEKRGVHGIFDVLGIIFKSKFW